MSSIFESSDVLPLFPTFVWKSRLKEAVRRPIDERIQALVAQLHVESTARGPSWQSRQDLHQRTELAELLRYIGQTTRSVLEFLRIADQAFEVTGCWANRSEPGAGHRMHSHPNNYLSGVYYVQVQAGADTINFHDPRAQTGIIRPAVTELVAANADQAVIKVSEGTLLLFPAWLPHSVDANASERPRISVSFNIMFSADAATISGPLWSGG